MKLNRDEIIELKQIASVIKYAREHDQLLIPNEITEDLISRLVENAPDKVIRIRTPEGNVIEIAERNYSIPTIGEVR